MLSEKALFTKNIMSDIPIYRGIALEGGGVAGTAYVGLVTVLTNIGLYDKLSHFAGSSAGAMVAGLMACRIKPSYIRKILLELDYRELEDSSWFVFRDIYRLYYDYGWNQGDAIEKIYGDILEEYVGDRNITYQQVEQKFNATLITTCTDIGLGSTTYYTPDSTPDIPIVKGIRESATLPLVFCPIKRDNTLIVDGGLLNNYPIQKLYEYLSEKEVFGAKFTSNSDKTKLNGHQPKVPESLIEYIQVLIEILHNQNLKVHVDKEDWKRTINIDVGNVSASDFDLSFEKKLELINTGEAATKSFFSV
jgi:predicted acylesterase/phospholipase RssA